MTALRGEFEPFFRERSAQRSHGRHRSVARARAFSAALGINLATVPSAVVVVGSKGKGTAATFAAATLSSLGMRTGLLTSPGLRHHRERIRVDGHAIVASDLVSLSTRIGRTLDGVAAQLPDDGYLSPTGLFTLAGLLHFSAQHCDVMVLEAGMGGRSDEVSMVAAAGVVVTPIFGEHIGVLANDIDGIVADKFGVISESVTAVTAVAQRTETIASTLAQIAGPRLEVIRQDDMRLEAIGIGPPMGVNALAGSVAAQRFAGVDASVADMHVALPARQSLHRRGEAVWGVDACVDGDGAQAALQWFRETVGDPTTVVAAIPDGKDQRGVLDAISGWHTVMARADADHLTFDQWPRPQWRVSEIPAKNLGDRVLALGSVSFVGEVLALLGVDTLDAYPGPVITAASRSSQPTPSR